MDVSVPQPPAMALSTIANSEGYWELKPPVSLFLPLGYNTPYQCCPVFLELLPPFIIVMLSVTPPALEAGTVPVEVGAQPALSCFLRQFVSPARGQERILMQPMAGWLPEETGKDRLSASPKWCSTSKAGPQWCAAKGEWTSGARGKREEVESA